MSLALRYGASGTLFLVALLLGLALFLPIERIHPSGLEPVDAGAWTIEGGLPLRDGNTTRSGSWYDDAYGGLPGVLMLRFGGPLLLVGTLVVLSAGFKVLSGQGVKAGWTATAGLLVAGSGMLLILLGIQSFAKDALVVGAVIDSEIRPLFPGFWVMFIGLLLGAGAALACFSVKPEYRGRVGPDGQPLPALPVLSVENPSAFNPMASRDPKPFRPEEHEYKTFEVHHKPRTFRREGEEPPAEEPAEAEAGDAKA